MKNLDLANGMIANLDLFAAHSHWQETVDDFRPLIEEIMEMEQCNAMKASIPFLKRFKDDGDEIGAKMLMAVVTQMMLNNVKN